jgi:hypothetical protein
MPWADLVAGGNLEADASGFFRTDSTPGVGVIRTRWQVSAISGDNQIFFLQVRSEGVGAVSGARTRAEFTAFRSCTAVALGCPSN